MRVLLILALGACDAAFGLRSLPPPIDAPRGDARDPSIDAAIDARPDAGPCTAAPQGCANAVVFECGSSCFASCLSQTTFAIARSSCMAWGGDLAMPSIADELTCVRGRIQTGAHFIGLQQTIGIADPGAGWLWVDATPLANPAWSSGEPTDGGDNAETGEEQCGWLHPSGMGDGRCEANFLWLCER